MRIFIAGATGVLGRRVVAKLVAAGHAVVGLSRSKRNEELLRKLGAEPRSGDLFDSGVVVRHSADCEAILHLATAIPTGSRVKGKDWHLNDRIRMEGTANLVHAALVNRCRLYVQEGVALLYGDRKGEAVREDTPASAVLPEMLYSAFEMETIVNEAVFLKKLPAVILRFGTFYSYDSKQTSSMFDLLQRGKFPVIGRGDAYWNLINIDDAADAVVNTIDRAGRIPGNIYNICDDEPVTYRVLVEYLAELLKAKKPRSIPRFLAKMILGSDLVSVLVSSAQCSNAKAKNELGWQPSYPTYREGMKAEVEKWRAAGSA